MTIMNNRKQATLRATLLIIIFDPPFYYLIQKLSLKKPSHFVYYAIKYDETGFPAFVL